MQNEIVTLRSLGLSGECDHLLRVGQTAATMNLCPFCGAEMRADGSWTQGSLDYPMQPVFANEMRAAIKRLEEAAPETIQ